MLVVSDCFDDWVYDFVGIVGLGEEIKQFIVVIEMCYDCVVFGSLGVLLLLFGQCFDWVFECVVEFGFLLDCVLLDVGKQ